MKALVKIAPIVVIIACAASLVFAFRLSGQKKGLQEDLASKTSELDQTRAKLGQTQSELATTTGQLKQTQNDLAAAKANLEAKDIELGQRRSEIEDLGRAKAAAEQEVAGLKAKVEQSAKEMAALQEKLGSIDVGSIEELSKKVEAMASENKVLGEKVVALTSEKEMLAKKLEEATTSPADLRGRVALAKSQWNFLIMDIGKEQRVQPNSEFLVYRDTSLVAKARVTTVYPNSSVADMVPGFTKSVPREGDTVVLKKM
jgi:chromosome segregation ATPase